MDLDHRVAVILAGAVSKGAVSKGAFEAGALKVLAEKLAATNGGIARIVGASSGAALKGTLLAAGVHSGDVPKAATALANLWVREGGLFQRFMRTGKTSLRSRGSPTEKTCFASCHPT